MIKICRRTTERSKKAENSLQQAKTKKSSYNTPEVNAALREMFYEKCYICENKQVTSYQIERLIPHRGDAELKYDWNNLFLACAHCNNTKLGKYGPIIDCTKENVEEKIAFRKKGISEQRKNWYSTCWMLRQRHKIRPDSFGKFIMDLRLKRKWKLKY